MVGTIEVLDPMHVEATKGPNYYNFDSVQFAIDTEGKGDVEARSEFVVAATPAGPVIQKTFAANIGSDLPQSWSPVGKPLGWGKAEVIRSGHKTQYSIHLDGTELYPFIFDESSTKTIRFW